MARKRLVTVEEAILLHLLDHSRHSPDDSVPIELAQAGIALALGVRRSHVSMSLDSAKSRGTVEEHLARVKGESRRRKCYFLTPGGREAARKLHEEIGGKDIIASLPDGSDFSGSMLELRERAGFAVARLALLCTEGRITLPMEGRKATSRGRTPDTRYFVGRKKEMKELACFFQGNKKLLQVTGMPGIGKTALVARSSAGQDIFWFDITEWSSPRNISNHLADYLEERGFKRMSRYLEAHEVPDISDIQDILRDIEFPLILISVSYTHLRAHET